MKYRFEFNFEVSYSISNASTQLGVSKEEIEESDFCDLFETGISDLESGDIWISDYAQEPEYDYNDDDLYAIFFAGYEIEVEGDSYDECHDKAQEAFEKCSLGDYEYCDGIKPDISSEVVEVTEKDISEYLEINGYDTQSRDEFLCQELANKCNARLEELYDSVNTDDMPLAIEVIEEVIGNEKDKAKNDIGMEK